MVWKTETAAAALALVCWYCAREPLCWWKLWCSMGEKPRHGFPFNTILRTAKCNKSLAFFIEKKI